MPHVESVFGREARLLYHGTEVPNGPWRAEGRKVISVDTGKRIAVCATSELAKVVAAIPDLIDLNFQEFVAD